MKLELLLRMIETFSKDLEVEDTKVTTLCFNKEESKLLNNYIKELQQKYEMQKDSNKLLCKAITCDDCNCHICEAHKENIRLQQQNKELKKTNASLQNALSLSRQKYNNDKSKYRRKYKREHNIITQFEKWLEEEIKQKQNSLQFYEGREPREIVRLEKEIPILKECLDKLQELKEGKKQ